MKQNNITPAFCIHSGCQMADKCMRAKAVTEADPEMVTIVNPCLTTGGEDCPYYAILQPVRHARGFLNIMGEVSRRQLDAITRELISHYGKNPYYEMRKGTRLIPPADQDYIRSVFQEHGIQESPLFDSYQDELMPVSGR